MMGWEAGVTRERDRRENAVRGDEDREALQRCQTRARRAVQASARVRRRRRDCLGLGGSRDFGRLSRHVCYLARFAQNFILVLQVLTHLTSFSHITHCKYGTFRFRSEFRQDGDQFYSALFHSETN
jgi:hypothetical protein